MYTVIEDTTDKLLQSIYLNAEDINIKFSDINELVFDLLTNSNIELNKMIFINEYKDINIELTKLSVITLEEMQSIWILIKNKTVESYIYQSEIFQKATSRMIEYYIPYCSAKLYLLNNHCEWNLHSIKDLKHKAQKCKY